jgi:hypothetical protein
VIKHGARPQSDQNTESGGRAYAAGLLGPAMQAALDTGPIEARGQRTGAAPTRTEDGSSVCGGALVGWQDHVYLAGGGDADFYFVRDYDYGKSEPDKSGSAHRSNSRFGNVSGSSSSMCVSSALTVGARPAAVVERLSYGSRGAQVRWGR